MNKSPITTRVVLAIATSIGLGNATAAQYTSDPLPTGGISLATETAGTVIALSPNTSGPMTTNRWNGTAFTPVTTSGPSTRALAAFAQEPAGGVILFGGSPGLGIPQPPNVTWRWNGTSWSILTTATTPPARFGAAAARIPGGNTVMFGGQVPATGGARLGDTWVFDGVNWTSVPGPGPTARVGAAMTSDGTSGVILFGGESALGVQNDTWRFDGTAWTNITPAVSPPARSFAGLSTDVQPDLGAGPRIEILMAGGAAPAGLTDVWSFQNGGWTSTSLSITAFPGWVNGSYDAIRGEHLFTDALSGGGLIAGRFGYTSYGTSCLCAGTGIGPNIIGGATNPVIGGSATYTVAGAVPNAAMFMSFDGAPAPGGIPVPPIFPATCLQFIGPTGTIDGTFLVAINGAGQGSFTLNIPNDILFIGTRIYHQGADFANACLTSAIETRVGR